MKRERIFYLDFIRALAVILILLTHYNALFLYKVPQSINNVVITYRICNLYIGDFGVSLFFIISGAALMYVYENKCDLKAFYKKRILGIYPLFWLSYIIAYVIQKVVYHVDYSGIPVKNFIYSVIGFDSYLAGIMPTFYIVGEWFLGCIILVYILFPLLRWGANKHPMSVGAALLLIYLLTIVCYSTPISKTILVGTRLPEVFFGMIYMKYFKKTNWKIAILALAVLVANTILAPQFNVCIQITYVGIAAFLVLTFIANFLKNKITVKVAAFFAKYCYSIFLIHHFVIYKVTDFFDLNKINLLESYGLFGLCAVCAILAAIALYYLDKEIQALIGKIILKIKVVHKQENQMPE